MTALLIVVVAVVVIVIVAFAAWAVAQRRRTDQLRREFGSEYSKTVHAAGDRSRAESELERRRKRVEALRIRPLPPRDARRLNAEWQEVQRRFVDEPSRAIAEADRLIREVMELRGYPVGDFEQRAADLSVDHGDVVSHYRTAHEISLRNERGQASTEELRSAMLNYRELFSDLLETQATRQKEAS